MLVSVGLLTLNGSPAVTGHARARASAAKEQIRSRLRHPNSLFQTGHFAEAAREYRELSVQALRKGNNALALRALNNLGGALSASYQYREASEAYGRAKAIADSLRDRAVSSALAANLASLYWQLDDTKAARRLAEESLRLAGPDDPFQIRAKVLTLVSCLRAHDGETGAALAGFREAIDAADRVGDEVSLAQAWDYLGIAQLNARQLPAAEEAFDEAFRLRKLDRLPALAESYRNLSELKLALNDSRSSEVLIEQAFKQAEQPPAPPLWSLYYQRGLVRRALNQPVQARSDFRRAIEAAREWRENLIAADDLRSSSGSGLRPVYAAFVESAAADPRSSREAFIAEEESRTAALTEALTENGQWRSRLPGEYWELLSRVRAEESARLAAKRSSETREEQAIRQRLTEIENLALPLSPIGSRTLEKLSPRNTLRGIQSQLMPQEALLSFHLGTRASWAWAITRNHFESRQLPSSRELIPDLRRFRAAVERSKPDRESIGAKLYKTLFGQFSRNIKQKSTWLIAADDELSLVPFAALSDASGRYLIEDHAILDVATVETLRDRSNSPEGPFLGLADGIYNSADPRLPHPQTKWSWGLLSAAPQVSDDELQLPRLVGSGREIERCAHRWGGSKPPVLLTGRQASRQSLERALKCRPGVIHLAVHVLQPPGHPEDASIDLGITRRGASDLLTRDDIANLPAAHCLVVMSGCASASAGVEAGVGVLGLTRAWILAGARAVVGSRWDIPDDSGELFEAFYSYLRANQGDHAADAPAALRLAQLDMLRSKNWRSAPKYWAAFYVVGKE